MKSFIIKCFTSALCLIFTSNNLFAQGCSDAGFCSIGAMKSGSVDSKQKYRNTLGLSITYGAGERSTTLYIPQVELMMNIGKRGYFEVKLPVYHASGKLGAQTGLGDPIINYTQTLRDKNNFRVQGTIGFRISTGNANVLDEKGVPLPMPYQSNLGTTDLILGVNTAIGKYLRIAAGYQQPIVQYNENGYLPSVIDMPGEEFFASRKLKRKGDVLLRLEGHYQWKHFGISGGPLLIYHLGKDQIMLTNGVEIALDGSEGTTLNISGNIFYDYKRFRFDITVGSPFVVRSYRPDGLTRSFVMTPRIIYRFGNDK